VVENWGVLAVHHWDSDAGTGWDERAWWLACRPHVALGRLLPPGADKADKAWEDESTTTAQESNGLAASIWGLGAI
jgi:hypothetical protein